MEYISINSVKDEELDKMIELNNIKQMNCSYSQENDKIDEAEKKILICKLNESANFNYNQVKTIKNDFTRILNFSNNSEVIQSSLEYNNHLLKSILENRNNLSSDEMALCMNILWTNLKKLAHCADKSIQINNSLSKDTKLLEIHSDIKKLKVPVKTKKANKDSGLMIVVNKSILNEYKADKQIEKNDLENSSYIVENEESKNDVVLEIE
jgi:hypothetical protein